MKFPFAKWSRTSGEEFRSFAGGSWYLLILTWMSLEYENFNVTKVTPSENQHFEPQNGGLEDDFPFQRGDFQVLC